MFSVCTKNSTKKNNNNSSTITAYYWKIVMESFQKIKCFENRLYNNTWWLVNLLQLSCTHTVVTCICSPEPFVCTGLIWHLNCINGVLSLLTFVNWMHYSYLTRWCQQIRHHDSCQDLLVRWRYRVLIILYDIYYVCWKGLCERGVIFCCSTVFSCGSVFSAANCLCLCCADRCQQHTGINDMTSSITDGQFRFVTWLSCHWRDHNKPLWAGCPEQHEGQITQKQEEGVTQK